MDYTLKKTYETLYKIDLNENTRIWYMELGVADDDTAAFRTVAGVENGSLVTSEWRVCKPKNVGKKNATTSVSQAHKEIKSNYTAKLEDGYVKDLNDLGSYSKFEPMLANDFSKLKDPIDFEAEKIYVQPKLDGIRCIAKNDGLWSRTGKEIVSIPHVWESIKHIFDEHPNIVIDGELYNHELKDDFNKITSLVRKTKLTETNLKDSKSLVQYHVYDMFDVNDPDAEFGDRIKYARSLISHCEYVMPVETIYVMDDKHCDDLYENFLERGYEGQMIRFNNPYETKRSKNLLKRKEFITDEFTVVSVEEGQGNWSGHVKRFILETPDGKMFGAGVRGKQPELKKLFKSRKVPDWATLRYFTPTPDGIPRFPVVIDYGFGTRDD